MPRNPLGLLTALLLGAAPPANEAAPRRPNGRATPRRRRRTFDPLQNRANRIARRAHSTANPRAWRL